MKGEKQRGLEEMSALRTDKLREETVYYRRPQRTRINKDFFFFAFLVIKASRDLDSARLFLSQIIRSLH